MIQIVFRAISTVVRRPTRGVCVSKGFILRYQEAAQLVPVQGRAVEPSKLTTQYRRDGVILAGTKTLTEATGEANDHDAMERSLRVIPR
jgi:hypothetical protein